MNDMIDPEIIEPSIDPATRKIGVRHVKATNAAGTRTKIQVRDFAAVYTDEPASLGGTNSAPSPLETVLVALVGCGGRGSPGRRARRADPGSRIARGSRRDDGSRC